MIRKFLVMVLVILFSGIVLALPPTVDFNFTPASPTIFTPIVFNPQITTSLDLNGLFWMFDVDGNTNYTRTYSPGGPSDYNIFYDDYSSGTLSSKGYTVTAGSWTGSGILQGGSLDGANIVHDINMTDVNAMYKINYRTAFPGGGLNDEFLWMGDTNDVSTITAYELLLQGATTLLRKRTAGTPSTLQSHAGLSTDTYHDVNIFHNTIDGNITVFIDGTQIFNVTNTTISSGNKLMWATEGTNTDANWDDVNVVKTLNISPSFTPTSPISLTQSETHTFVSGGTKTVCLTGQNSDGSTTACHTIDFVGGAQFKIFDENTHARILNAIAIFDGVSYGSDVNGVISIPTPTVAEDKIIEVYANGYPSRFFTYPLDINASVGNSLYLLDQNKGRDIAFVIRDLNATKYPFDFLRIVKDQNIVARVYLDSKALSIPLYLANLVTDYNFFIDQNSTANTNIFSYGDSTLQINIPKNENTLETVSPYNIQISDLTTVDINNLSTNQLFKIYPNTYHPYHITVDANNLDYFERYYDVRSLGGQSSDLLQPYLLRAIDNGIPATMIVKDSLSSLSLQYYMFKFYTGLNQMENVLVESPQTDSAGTFIFTTVTGKNYFIQIYDPYGDLLKQGQFISSTSSQYFIDLFSGVISGQEPQTGIVDINLLIPSNNFFFLNDSNNFGLTFITNTNGPSITSVQTQVYNNDTLIAGTTFTPVFPATTFPDGTIFDANFSTSLNNINTKVIITATTSTGIVTKTYMFPLKQDTNPQISFPGFATFCSNIGGFGCALIWLFIGILISIGLRFNPIFGVDNNGMFWVMAIWTGIASFMGIVPYQIGFIAILAGASFWAIRNRPIG